jgi:hypothetical protein
LAAGNASSAYWTHSGAGLKIIMPRKAGAQIDAAFCQARRHRSVNSAHRRQARTKTQ